MRKWGKNEKKTAFVATLNLANRVLFFTDVRHAAPTVAVVALNERKQKKK